MEGWHIHTVDDIGRWINYIKIVRDDGSEFVITFEEAVEIFAVLGEIALGYDTRDDVLEQIHAGLVVEKIIVDMDNYP